MLALGAFALAGCRPPAPAAGPAATTTTTGTSTSTTVAPAPGSTLAAPSWWAGACDSGNDPGGHALGASYRGVAVCGPRPNADHATDRLVQFFSGAWGEQEWECVELSMRFLYLADGVVPYPANGKDVYANYAAGYGGGLVKIANGTVGTAPVPGDVLTFGGTTTNPNGHTGVVESTSIDASGTGTLRMLSQNDTVDGWRTITVTAWTVNGLAPSLGSVPGWLHKP